jgi:hypothetical protein
MDHHLLSHRILLGTELNKLWSGFLNKLIPYLPIELTMRNSVWLTKRKVRRIGSFTLSFDLLPNCDNSQSPGVTRLTSNPIPIAIPWRGKRVYSPLQQAESLLTLYLARFSYKAQLNTFFRLFIPKTKP